MLSGPKLHLQCSHGIPAAAFPLHLCSCQSFSQPLVRVASDFGPARLPPAPPSPQAPTPKLFADVQAGTPGETLHRPTLQPRQPSGQSLQLVGSPLSPVQKHRGAAAGAPPSRARPARASGGTNWGSPAPAARVDPGVRTSGALRPAAGAAGRRRVLLEAAQRPRGAHKGPFFSLLQTLHKFHFPPPVRALRPRGQDALVMEIISMKRGAVRRLRIRRRLGGQECVAPSPGCIPAPVGMPGGPSPHRDLEGNFLSCSIWDSTG